MGYYTRYTVTADVPNIDLKETAVVKDITNFLQSRDKKIDEQNIVALISKFPQHFKINEVVDEGILEERLEEISGYSLSFGEQSDGIKWYERDENMKLLSSEYPTVKFTVEGIGEEQGDIWRATYFAGKGETKKAKIVFE